jgi:hypothetical protein
VILKIKEKLNTIFRKRFFKFRVKDTSSFMSSASTLLPFCVVFYGIGNLRYVFKEYDAL